MVAGSLAIIYIVPRFTKAVPSPLIAIVMMTILSVALHLNIRTVGDMGQITRDLPSLHIPTIPLTLESLSIIFPYALALSLVGILESLLTATIIDEMTETSSNKNREVKGQGIANIIVGIFGGMAGCAMIGQSVINIKSGGKTRLSTLAAGVCLFIFLLLFADIVKKIPMAALVGVMITVAIGTFEWQSLKTLHKIAQADAVIMIITVAVVVVTNDLSKGVITGVILSTLCFGWKISRLHATTTLDGEQKTYTISGQLFFGTTSHFMNLFNITHDPSRVVIDLRHSHIWDHSAVTAFEKILKKYQQVNKQVTIIRLNEESLLLLKRTGVTFAVDQI
jgi:SulP family sulfate permease